MTDINIENIVVTTKIAESLDLNRLAEEIPYSKYNPEEVQALIIHFKNPTTAVMLFSNGNVVFTGPRNNDEVDEIIKMLSDKLKAIGVEVYPKPEINIKNIVASADLKKNFDLNSIANSIGNAEYNPELFPGLIYKTDAPNTVILLFNSGKIVCNGKESEEISTAIDNMTNELSSLGIL